MACLAGALALIGCATPAVKQNPAVWEPSAQWWAKAEKSQAHLTKPNGEILRLSAQSVRSLRSAQRSLSTHVQIDYDLALADIEAPNAYALRHNGRSKVVIGLPLISVIGDDQEAYAFVLAHEIGHHALAHAKDNPADNPARSREQAGAALGTLSSLVVPFSGILVNQLMTGWGRYYSREQERAADDFAFTQLDRLGISSCGAWRLLDRLEIDGAVANPLQTFLSTHPNLAERRQKAACPHEQSAKPPLGRSQ